MGNAQDIESGARPRRDARGETEHTKGLDNQELYELNETSLKDQEHALKMIGQTADRLLVIGQSIGKEVDEQTPLIGKIKGGVEDTTERIEKATRQVKQATQQGSAPWCLW